MIPGGGRLDGDPPFLKLLIGLRQVRDVIAGLLEGDELAAVGQRYRIVEFSVPSRISHRHAAAASNAPAYARRDRSGDISLRCWQLRLPEVLTKYQLIKVDFYL
jgi:hypothetical protein